MASKLSLAIALFSIIGLHHCDLLENNESYDYLCDNGTPPLEKSDEPDVKKCADCNPSYTLEGGACMKDSTANGGTAGGSGGTAGSGGSGGTAGSGGSGGTAGSGGSGGTAGSGGSGGTAGSGDSGGTSDGGDSGGTSDGGDSGGTSDGGDSGGTTGGSLAQYPYICTNGNPVTDEMATAPNTEKCASCNNPEPPAEPNYILLESNQTCVGFRRFTCENGTPADALDLVQSTEKCDRCDDGYRLTDPSRQMTCATRTETCFVCSINLYRCENGSPVEPTDGNRPTTHETETKCKSCDDNYVLVPVDSMEPSGAKQCLSDADADGRHDLVDRCPNGQTGWRSLTTTNQATEEDQDGDGCRDMDEDVDDDNDGLIEIHELNALHNIRWNPDGTSYDDEEDDGTGNLGDARGAPLTATVDCKGIDHDDDEGNPNPTPRVGIDHDSNPTTPRIFLCGYELMRDLDFADDNSYANPADPANKATWCPPTSPVTDPPSCLVTNTRHAGFPGLGENFNAVFHGNGHSIRHLYMRTSGNVGLFRSTASAAIIKQIGLENVHVYGNQDGSGNTHTGTLVGYNRGWIAASHAIKTNSGTSRVEGRGQASNNNFVGGLVGWNHVEGKIIASYTQEIAVRESDHHGHTHLGGLVGWNNGWIIACYAVANVSSDQTATILGGLVGRNDASLARAGIIRASYTKGTVTQESSTFGNVAGGLVGEAHFTDIRASYANANVINESQEFQDKIGRVIGAPYLGIEGEPGVVNNILLLRNGNALTFNYGFGTQEGSIGGNYYPIPAACGNDFQSRTGYLRGACQHQPLDGVPPRGCGSGTDRCTIHTLTLAAAGTQWDSAQWATQGAWDFGGTGPNSPPKLKYNDYDGSGGINYHHHTFNIECDRLFPEGACDNGGTLIPGQ